MAPLNSHAAGDVEVTGTKNSDDSRRAAAGANHERRKIVLARDRRPRHDRPRMVLYAQGLGEYAGAGSNAPLAGSARDFGSTLLNGIRDIDQQTWLLLAGGAILLLLFTRRSKQR
jgi:hypothetical protein